MFTCIICAGGGAAAGPAGEGPAEEEEEDAEGDIPEANDELGLEGSQSCAGNLFLYFDSPLVTWF